MIALTRALSPAIVECELTHLERSPIDLERARAQHSAYERALADGGCEVRRLPEAPELPDSVFVEDAAVVFEEAAILTRPGAASRRPEIETVAPSLEELRRLLWIRPPATLDGGDVLVVGRRVFVGQTPRSNAAGHAQLASLLAPYGYTVESVSVHGCLHLKSAVTSLGGELILLQPAWIDVEPFLGFDRVEVHPAEPFAANAVRLRDRIIYPAAFPRTRERIEARGLRVACVEADELAKAEGGVTCCSLLVPPRRA